MRQIDKMSEQEIDTLKLKGMLPEDRVAPHGYSQSDAKFNSDLTRERVEAERAALSEQPKSIQGAGEPTEIGAAPDSARLQVAATVDYYEKRKLDHIKQFQDMKAHAERLAEALRDCLINNPKHFTPSMNAALTAWEAAQ